MPPTAPRPSAASAKRPGEKKKRIDEVISHAVRHGTRVQLLIILNDGAFTTSELAHMVGKSIRYVSNHLRELLDSGSIEIAKTRNRRNTDTHWYRAVESPDYSDEEFAALTPQQQDVTMGLVIQSMFAEILAGLRSGKMRGTDPGLWVTWDWFNVDSRGRREIATVQETAWEQIRDIEVASINRSAVSREATSSILVSQTGFPRARKGSDRPKSSGSFD